MSSGEPDHDAFARCLYPSPFCNSVDESQTCPASADAIKGCAKKYNIPSCMSNAFIRHIDCLQNTGHITSDNASYSRILRTCKMEIPCQSEVAKNLPNCVTTTNTAEGTICCHDGSGPDHPWTYYETSDDAPKPKEMFQVAGSSETKCGKLPKPNEDLTVVMNTY